MNEITKRTIDEYKNYLVEEEKCSVTIEKYIRDINAFAEWSDGRGITKTLVLEYKSMLTQQYAPASVNSVLSSLNGYFNYIERYDLKVKNLKVQRQIFCQSEKELTKAEYERLLKAAKSKKNERLYLIMQTICATLLNFLTASLQSKGWSFQKPCNGLTLTIISHIFAVVKSFFKLF